LQQIPYQASRFWKLGDARSTALAPPADVQI
jgi:hypothetical protein